MNCCKHKYFVIYRGDDTDFPGNQELIVELNTERDLTGCSAHFSFQGFTQDFAEIPSDKKLRLVIPNSETGKFALGAADAKLWLTNGTKIRTVENRIHVVVTNNVNEAYNNDDPQAITVTISGGGSGATVVLDDTVTETSSNGVKSSGIWSWAKSLLPQWLTSDYAEPATAASVAAKADKSALDSHVKNTNNPHAVTAAQVGSVPFVDDSNGEKTAVTIGNREYSRDVGNGSLANGFNVSASGAFSHAEGTETIASGNYSHAEGGNTTASGYLSHAAGYMAQTREVDAYSFAWNGDRARIDQYSSHGPGTFNINPLDGIKGFYIGEENLASIMANKADEFTEWVASEGAPSDLIGQPYLDKYTWVWERTAGTPYFSDYNTDPNATSLNFSDNGFTATRKRVLRTGDAATPQELIDAISTNNPAFVSAVQNTPTSGMPEDMPTDWGTFGAVGTALAALAAGLKWCKNILGSLASGYSTFAAWIASKLDRASLLIEYSATSAYSVGAIVCYDGSIYQCKTAIAEGGEAWNEEHWELRKLYDFFTESNSLLNGRLSYSRNATGLKDRAFNTISFDGTEFNLSTALESVTPTASGQPRDLLIVATATAATTISFTAGTIKGDKPTIDGAGTWLITLTEYAANTWYCRQIKMEDAA